MDAASDVAHSRHTQLHLVFMVISVVAGLLVKNYGNDAVLDLPGFKAGCVDGTTRVPGHDGFDSLACAGNQVIFRFSFALVVFFSLLAFGTICSRMLHHGLWALKVVLYVVLNLGLFFLPNGATWPSPRAPVLARMLTPPPRFTSQDSTTSTPTSPASCPCYSCWLR